MWIKKGRRKSKELAKVSSTAKEELGKKN